ncbi:MAG: alpha/beta hydrolase [Lachnospiraceae bacterium]|nr:alpha/beta hydrolase [Lachnospiraceae bacterium]
MDKLAVLFPGIGYTNDRPLLYYSAYVARHTGYEVKKLEFHDLPDGVFNDEKKIMRCFELSLDQAGQALSSVDFSKYVDVIFISKSLGTAVAAVYASKHNIDARHILFTPLDRSLSLAKINTGIAFHGTADPWANTGVLTDICAKKNIPLHLIENANHSLETGDLATDLSIMSGILQTVSDYIGY